MVWLEPIDDSSRSCELLWTCCSAGFEFSFFRNAWIGATDCCHLWPWDPLLSSLELFSSCRSTMLSAFCKTSKDKFNVSELVEPLFSDT
jgi:hypothetical protein